MCGSFTLLGGEAGAGTLVKLNCLGKENTAEMKRVKRKLEEEDKSPQSSIKLEKAAAQRAVMEHPLRLLQGDSAESGCGETA